MPPWQVVPAAQRALHEPQFALFDVRSRHVRPHWLVPPVQTHAPPAHVSPPATLHVTPQPPQLAGSVWSGMHAPLQYASPGGQLQVPLTQVDVPPHTLPHAPQLFVSLIIVVHEPLQFVVPAAHDAVQAPAEQTCPDMHTTPHAPQLLGSLCMSVHALLQSV